MLKKIALWLLALVLVAIAFVYLVYFKSDLTREELATFQSPASAFIEHPPRAGPERAVVEKGHLRIEVPMTQRHAHGTGPRSAPQHCTCPSTSRPQV